MLSIVGFWNRALCIGCIAPCDNRLSVVVSHKAIRIRDTKVRCRPHTYTLPEIYEMPFVTDVSLPSKF